MGKRVARPEDAIAPRLVFTTRQPKHRALAPGEFEMITAPALPAVAPMADIPAPRPARAHVNTTKVDEGYPFWGGEVAI